MRINRNTRTQKRKIFLTVAIIVLFCFETATAVTNDLFISEYLEGSSYSKAIEIYNGTGSSVDLTASAYNLKVFFNGSTTAATIITLTGVIAPGDVYVVAPPKASAEVLAQADQVSSTNSWFNGNDAVVLYKGTDVVDSIGKVGEDPGTYWGNGTNNTFDHTLVRKSSISAGDTNISDTFDPSVEWEAYAVNTTSYLGSHQIDTFFVQYYTNGGSNISSETVIINTAAQQPDDPSKTGYLFNGWYTDSNLTTEYDFSSAVTADTYLFAKWTEAYPQTGDESHIALYISACCVSMFLLAAVIILRNNKKRLGIG